MPPTLDPAPLVDLARRVKHLPDRLLHGRRRDAALARVRAARPRSIVVICRGNICRSPFGERFLRTLVGGDAASIRVESAGFMVSGKPSPADALEAAREMGLEMDDHRSRRLTPEIAWSADLLVVMESWHTRHLKERYGVEQAKILHLGDLDPRPIAMRTVQDPVTRGIDHFRRCYRRIARSLRVLAENLPAVEDGPDARPVERRATSRASAG